MTERNQPQPPENSRWASCILAAAVVNGILLIVLGSVLFWQPLSPNQSTELDKPRALHDDSLADVPAEQKPEGHTPASQTGSTSPDAVSAATARAQRLQSRAVQLGMRASYREAISIQERVVEIHKQNVGEDSSVYVISLGILGNLFVKGGQPREGELRLKAAQAILERNGVTHGADMAAVMRSLATCYSRQGRLDEAEQLYREIRKRLKEQPQFDAATYCGVTHDLAEALATQGRFPAASQRYDEAIRLHRHHQLTEDYGYCLLLSGQAAIYRELGEYTQAAARFEEALVVQKRILGDDHRLFLETRHNLGLLYTLTNDIAAAERIITEVLKVRAAQFGETDPDTVTSKFDLGRLRVKQGRFDEAIKLLRDVVERDEGQRIDQGLALHQLSKAYRQARRARDAEKALRKARSLFHQAGADQSYAAVVTELGGIHLDLGELEKAEQQFSMAVDVFERLRLFGDPFYAEAWGGLAAVYAKTRQTWLAANAMQQQRRVLHARITKLLPLMPTRDQYQFRINEDHPSYQKALSLLGSKNLDDADFIVDCAAEWVINGKGLTRDAIGFQQELIRRSQNQEQRQELQTIHSAIANLVTAGLESHDSQAKLTSLQSQADVLLRRIGISGDALQLPWVELDEIRDALPSDTVLIEMVDHIPWDIETGKWLAQRYFALIIPPRDKGKVNFVELGSAGQINPLINELVQQIQKDGQRGGNIEFYGEQQATASLRSRHLNRLSERLLLPLEPHIAEFDSWLISADGALWFVPWAALNLQVSPRKFVVEGHFVAYLSSGRDLVQVRPQSAASEPAIVASPRFADRSDLVARGEQPELGNRFSFGPLPGTIQEAERTAELFRNTGLKTRVLIGADASETAVKSLACPKYLLLGTHAFYEPKRIPVAVDEMVFTGLALAGANSGYRESAEDDGVLNGLEVLAMDLRGTEVVMLSACDTGIGSLKMTEGVVSLRRAFELAGAKSVVATLWKVSDEAVADLSARFWRRLLAGDRGGEAISRAQRAVIKARRNQSPQWGGSSKSAAHPFYWAAFTITGVR